jgi:hypothetical protein
VATIPVESDLAASAIKGERLDPDRVRSSHPCEDDIGPVGRSNGFVVVCGGCVGVAYAI